MREPGGGNAVEEPPPENRFAIFDLPARGRWNGVWWGEATCHLEKVNSAGASLPP
jgi:hypothetical protein